MALSQAARAAGEQARRRPRRGAPRRPSSSRPPTRRPSRCSAVPAEPRPGRAPLRHHLDPAAGRPELRQPRRLRPVEARRHAEGALRLPLPQQERGADHRPPASRHDRRRATRGDRALPAGRLEPALQAHRRQLHRHRRPCRRDAGARELRSQTLLLLGVAGLVMALTLLLSCRGRCACCPLGRRRGGCPHPRPGGPVRRIADRGGDRNAPRARRAGGRLRNIVPGPLQRGQGGVDGSPARP